MITSKAHELLEVIHLVFLVVHSLSVPLKIFFCHLYTAPLIHCCASQFVSFTSECRKLVVLHPTQKCIHDCAVHCHFRQTVLFFDLHQTTVNTTLLKKKCHHKFEIWYKNVILITCYRFIFFFC